MANADDKGDPVPSPYKVDQDAADRAAVRDFVVRAEPILEPSLAEVLSDETRKAQRSLLAFSFLLILLALGAVTFTGKVKYLDLEASLDAQVLLKVTLALCAYFEILVVIRSFTDWNAFRIKTSVAQLDLDALDYELYRVPIRPFSETKEGLRILSERNWASVESGQDAKSSIEDVWIRKEQEHIRNMRIAIKKSKWFRRRLAAIRGSRWARFAWEILFPVSFGAIAIGLAARAILWGM